MGRTKKMRALERPSTVMKSPPATEANIEDPDGQNLDIESAQPNQVAEYLTDLLEEARDIAAKAELKFLSYLIQVAVEEARIQATPKEPRY
jgi:hypothetical protein